MAEKKEEQKPDYAPRSYEIPKMDFSDTNLEIPKNEAPAAAATKTHTVDKGESLWAIAEHELGDGKRWKEIYEANKDVIGANPDLIQPGMELKIPS
jgi:nucleoid-associated protein YgaU